MNDLQRPSGPPPAPEDDLYAALASFRRTLRVFIAFSGRAAQQAGLTRQQHQAILAIKGFGRDKGLTVGDLAGHLLLKPHTVVGLVDRLERAGLVVRETDMEDRRRVILTLTPKATALLERLSAAHLAEIRRNAPELIESLGRLSGDR